MMEPHSEHSGASVDRKSTRLNSSHANISYAVFCLKKWRSEEFLHANAPGFVPREDRATQQNTSGDSPCPLLTYSLLPAYIFFWSFGGLGPLIPFPPLRYSC